MRALRQFVRRTDLKLPGDAGPHHQQWDSRDGRDSDEGKRGSAPLRDEGGIEWAQGVPEGTPVASGLLADDGDDATRMHQQSRGDLEHTLAHAQQAPARHEAREEAFRSAQTFREMWIFRRARNRGDFDGSRPSAGLELLSKVVEAVPLARVKDEEERVSRQSSNCRCSDEALLFHCLPITACGADRAKWSVMAVPPRLREWASPLLIRAGLLVQGSRRRLHFPRQ